MNRFVAAVAWSAALQTGCSPGNVTTVQPGAVDKSALTGEWYLRRTIASAPFGTAATFTGAQGQLERIRWEIQEDLLLGYRSYAHVDADGADDSTAALLTFPITDQFDIRRGYDRTTGEESNVIEENREAPWYDRGYIRVDWSANLAETDNAFAGLPVDVLAWVTGDDRADDAPQFDDSNGDGVIDSLMLTQHALVAPDTVEYPGYGDVPVCLFFGQAEYECGPTEVSIVQSLVRVGDRAPVEGLVYDDKQMETFGYFSTERIAYDRGYGLVEPNRVRYANRHPLWQQSLATDGAGRVLCAIGGTEAPCEAFDLADGPVPVELPYRERVPRPIVYHPGPGFPDDLQAAMAEVAELWNEPLRDTVNGLRYWECIDDGGKPVDCHALEDPNLQMFVWCPHAPSALGDPEVCSTDHTGPDGRPDGLPDPVAIGDLRYHLAVVVSDPQLSSPYGYGPSAADPSGTTFTLRDGGELHLGAGEIISANAFLYEHVLDRVSHQVADLVQLLNGATSPEAFVEGEDVSAWIAAANGGTDGAFVGTTWGMPAAWNEDLVRDRLSRMSNGFAPLIAPYVAPLDAPLTPAAVEPFLRSAADAIGRSGVFGAGAAEADANFAAMMASPYDDLAWAPETIGGYGFDPATQASAMTGRSPFELVDPLLAGERERWRVLAGQNAVDLDADADGAFTDTSLLGLARDYAKRGLTYDQIVDDVRTNSFREVMLHEVGHTLGLRHNFGGSFDAFNFRPEYWDLRLDGDAGPRHVDPETDAEIDGQIRSFQYSTVMDYPGSRNVGWAGLGHYDAAAVKFGYGGLVEVLTAVPDAETVPGLPNVDGISFVSAYASSHVLPSVLLFYNTGAILDLHYTQYPAMAGDLEARADVPLSRLEPTIGESGSFADGYVVASPMGEVKDGMPAVPYRFCSDEFAVGMTCARFDEGADPYESQVYLTERYWNDYLLTNFARQRYGYGDPAAYVSRLQDRIFEPLRTWQRYYALFHGIFQVDADPYAQDFFAADRGWGGWTAATDASFRFLTQVITRPEPGPHGEMVRPDGVSVLAPGFGDDEVPLVTGAYFESDWDYDSGYFWFERQNRVGTYWDRMLALHTLADTASYDFIGYDTATDPRQYAIGFQDLYRDDLATLLGRLAADDVDALAPAQLADGTIVYPDPLRPDLAWPPAGAVRVEPATYWLVRYDADLFGMALTSHGYDRSYLNRSRVYVEGSPAAITPGPDQAVVSFTDPASGKTFTAWSFPQLDDAGQLVRNAKGEPVELGASARMLGKAALLASRCADAGLPADQVAAACAESARFSADLDLHAEMYAAFEGATP